MRRPKSANGPLAVAAVAVAEPLEARRLMVAYRLVDLGTLGGANSFAYDVNDSGVVVGYANNAAGQERAFRFFDANGNNDADPGEMAALGVLPGHAHSYAFGINNDGDNVGAPSPLPASNPSAVTHAVHFGPGGAVT